MKRNETQRLVIILLLATGLLGSALLFSRSSSQGGFATPGECVEAYGEALKAGDVDKYLNCLGEPARGQVAGRAESLRRDAAGLVAWVQIGEPRVEESVASVEVDEVRKDATRRTRFRLEHSSHGWLIVDIEPVKEAPAPIRHGTHVSEAPESGGKP